jgi:ssDNA-binding Zn-finger/Zn-ribbon topoisomerase 1
MGRTKAGGAKRGKVDKQEKTCPLCGTSMRPVKELPGNTMYWACTNVKEDTKNWKFDVICDYREPLRKGK